MGIFDALSALAQGYAQGHQERQAREQVQAQRNAAMAEDARRWGVEQEQRTAEQQAANEYRRNALGLQSEEAKSLAAFRNAQLGLQGDRVAADTAEGTRNFNASNVTFDPSNPDHAALWKEHGLSPGQSVPMALWERWHEQQKDRKAVEEYVRNLGVAPQGVPSQPPPLPRGGYFGAQEHPKGSPSPQDVGYLQEWQGAVNKILASGLPLELVSAQINRLGTPEDFSRARFNAANSQLYPVKDPVTGITHMMPSQEATRYILQNADSTLPEARKRVALLNTQGGAVKAQADLTREKTRVLPQQVAAQVGLSNARGRQAMTAAEVAIQNANTRQVEGVGRFMLNTGNAPGPAFPGMQWIAPVPLAGTRTVNPPELPNIPVDAQGRPLLGAPIPGLKKPAKQTRATQGTARDAQSVFDSIHAAQKKVFGETNLEESIPAAYDSKAWERTNTKRPSVRTIADHIALRGTNVPTWAQPTVDAFAPLKNGRTWAARKTRFYLTIGILDKGLPPRSAELQGFVRDSVEADAAQDGMLYPSTRKQ